MTPSAIAKAGMVFSMASLQKTAMEDLCECTAIPGIPQRGYVFRPGPPGSAQMRGVDRFGRYPDHRDLLLGVVQDEVRKLRVPDVRFRAREEKVVVAEAGSAEHHLVDALVDRLGPPLL